MIYWVKVVLRMTNANSFATRWVRGDCDGSGGGCAAVNTIGAPGHWSLVVVVNPGSILAHRGMEEGPLNAAQLELPFPCLLHLDSMRGTHPTLELADAVRGWLNFEWDRKYENDVQQERAPFSRRAMVVGRPVVGQQNNGYDCGVFTCRYAYGLLRVNEDAYNYKNAGVSEIKDEMVEQIKPLFSRYLGGSGEFDFDQTKMDGIRANYAALITRLNGRYGE